MVSLAAATGTRMGFTGRTAGRGTLVRLPPDMGRIVANSRDQHAPKILDQLRTGAALAEICRADGMPTRETVRLWCRDDPGFAAQVLEAREDGYLERAERAVKAAKEATDPQLGRLAFDAERWILGKLSIGFAERAPRIDNQTNLQVNLDGDAFGRIRELMEGAAAAIASGARSTHLVAFQSEAGPGDATGGLDDVAALDGPGMGQD